MSKKNTKANITFTPEEYEAFKEEAKLQDRPIANLGRRYINEGVRKDKKDREDKK